MLKVSKSYWTKSGSKEYTILDEFGGISIGRLKIGIGHPWATYDINGKCLDHDCYGDRRDFLDLKVSEEYVPWTQETFPVNTWFKLKKTSGRGGMQALSFDQTGVCFRDYFATYKTLLDEFVTHDGQPCGKKAE